MVDELGPAMKKRSPDEVVAHALAEHCTGIVFCFNDPAVAYPTFLALAQAARDQGLLVGCSTNGYFTANALAGLMPFLDCVSVGVKGCSDAAYRSCGVPVAAPVFSTIQTLVKHHIHVEVSLVHVRGHEQDFMDTAEKIGTISLDIPIQVMRFVAFGTADLRLEPSIGESENLCNALRKKFPFVYLFNSPGSEYLDSRCPICGSCIISREMFGPMGAYVIESRQNAICQCGYHLPITGTIASLPFAEHGMMGGYRPTRALETIDAYLVCLGVTDKESRIRVWVDFMQRNYINELHMKIQTVEGSYEIISHLAKLTGHESRGEELIQYMKARVTDIATRIEGAAKPRVYYMMGLPRFALNEGRFEMRLVELAGGEITNRNLPRQGKPGVMITDEDIRPIFHNGR
jgi:pyruvate formate lyase activating enzyme